MANINWGSILTNYASSLNRSTRACQISSNRIAICYHAGADLRVSIVEFDVYSYSVLYDTKPITSSLNILYNNNQACCKIDEDLFAVTYNSGGAFRVRLLYWNGSAIVDYGQDIGYTANSTWHGIVQIETNKIMAFYRSGGTILKAVVGTCNDGVSLTWGTPVTIRSNNCTHIDSVKIGSGKAFIAFRNSSLNRLEAMVVESPAGLSDRTLSFGSVAILESSITAYFVSTGSTDNNDKVVVCYGRNAAVGGRAIACTISGTIISYGSYATFETGETKNTSCVNCYEVANTVLVAYEDVNDSNKGKTCKLAVDWGTRVVTPGDTQTFSDNSVGGGLTEFALDMVLTDSYQYFICFKDITDSGYGKVIMNTNLLDFPSNISVVPGEEQNTTSWDVVAEADSYNLYWMIYNYFDEDFNTDLSDWDIYKDDGNEVVQISSGKLHGDISTGTDWHLARKTELPSGDFRLETDLVTYTPDNSSFGFYAVFSVLDEYTPLLDYARILYYVSSGGAQHNITSYLYINGVNWDTGDSIAGQPTKLRIDRVGNIISMYYYITSWVLIQERDFSTRAANLDLVVYEGKDNITNGGLTEWDNLIYYKDLMTEGTKIAGVTSPYTHTSLIGEENYIYVLTSENAYIESEVSDIYNGTPTTAQPPDPPTSISAIKDEGFNTINFTVDPEADETHIYWANSPGVTVGTGTKISDVSSPYTHIDLNPSLTYYYILTSEDVIGEGDPSSEYNSSPLPEAPTGIGAVAGVEKNVISWTEATGADSYNIYWKTSAGVTKANGTKITGVSSPYTHIGLNPYQPYYYVVTSEDEDGESDISSEVTATPYPAVGANLPQEPVDQYSILSTFSENTKDNLSKLSYPTIGTPPVSGYNRLVGDLYDLYEDIDFNSCLTDNSFDIEEVNSTSIKVTTGRCIIGGVCIDIKEDKILNIDNENSYFNWVNTIAGAGTVYILIYYDYNYDAEVDAKKAYIGLMEKTDYEALTTEQKEYYCLLGVIKVNSLVEIISPLYYWDPDDTSQNRPHPKGFADGGWLDLPEDYII